MSSSRVTDIPGRLDPASAAGQGGEWVALGTALQARSRKIAGEVASRLPAQVRLDVEQSARLATEVIGRWVATGERDEQECRVLARTTEQVILVECDLESATRAYLGWRDVCGAALTDDAGHLGVGEEVVAAALAFVQSACDAGLVRTVRSFDRSWQVLQERLRLQQDVASHQVLHDDLTGLANRVLLCDRLQHASHLGGRRTTGSILLYLDIDNFTAINARCGRRAGDTLLVAVARRLAGVVRAADTVARVGGDEFVILAEDFEEPEQAARSMAERIHQAMCVPVIIDHRELHASISIGITEMASGLDSETLLARAEAAMYRAKQGGPVRFAVYDVGVESRTNDADELVDELRVAHSHGELTLAFQPQFRLEDGHPHGLAAMEAFLRWDHPDRGQIDPGVFLPLLERSRQIVAVGRWVLEEAASQCVEWQRRFPGLTMSVNVSARQMDDPGFLADVGDALVRSGLDPAHLVLEVTEPDLVVDVVRMAAAMEAVRALGVRVALDDFASGHSSLQFLQSLTFDQLKVDRTFVSGLDPDGRHGTVDRTVVDLAHHLGVTVVAEGVETVGELRAVGAIGCDEVQGLLFGEPVPAHLQTFHFAHLVGSPS